MDKRTCPKCGQVVAIEEVGKERQPRMETHLRVKSSTEEVAEFVHLRNVMDEICPGSGS
jgi:hypothetical protein